MSGPYNNPFLEKSKPSGMKGRETSIKLRTAQKPRPVPPIGPWTIKGDYEIKTLFGHKLFLIFPSFGLFIPTDLTFCSFIHLSLGNSFYERVLLKVMLQTGPSFDCADFTIWSGSTHTNISFF